MVLLALTTPTVGWKDDKKGLLLTRRHSALNLELEKWSHQRRHTNKREHDRYYAVLMLIKEKENTEK